jgi:carbon starvation protein
LDAGTRVARFMLQDIFGNFVADKANLNGHWIKRWPGVLLTSGLVVSGWGYFLYMGTIDPLGGINSLWPLFGIANQMLATIALCVATTVLVKAGKARFFLVTAMPLLWLIVVTSTAAFEKLFSQELRVGFLTHAVDLSNKLAEGKLSPAQAATAPQLIFNDYLDAALALLFLVVTWVLVLDTVRVIYNIRTGGRYPPSTESPYQPIRAGGKYLRD